MWHESPSSIAARTTDDWHDHVSHSADETSADTSAAVAGHHHQSQRNLSRASPTAGPDILLHNPVGRAAHGARAAVAADVAADRELGNRTVGGTVYEPTAASPPSPAVAHDEGSQFPAACPTEPPAPPAGGFSLAEELNLCRWEPNKKGPEVGVQRGPLPRAPVVQSALAGPPVQGSGCRSVKRIAPLPGLR